MRDAHVHLASGAVDRIGLDLTACRDAAAIARAVAAAVRPVPPGSLLRGWGWSGEPPPDEVAPDHPVVLARTDGHGAWLSPAAREAFGAGDAGVLEEASFDRLRARLPRPALGERVEAARARLAEVAAHGVTAIDDMVDPDGPELYAALRDRGEIPVEAALWLPEDTPEAEADAMARSFPLRIRGIKIFLDGTLGARTAALFEPYADDPGNDGRLRAEPRELRERIERWAGRGWPVALHAIGDRAVALALDVLETVPRPRGGAHRIEHAQVVRTADLPRFARAGIVASIQPGHWADDRPWLGSRLGARPLAIVHPLASLARAGAAIAIGSDWPVSSWDPAYLLAAATDRARGAEAVSPLDLAAWYTSTPP